MADWSDQAPIVEVACPLCADGGVRRRVSGTVWGAPEAMICRCSVCQVVFLHPMMSTDEEKQFYEAEFAHYMRDRGAPGETQPEEHFEKNRTEAHRRLANLQPYLRPDARVLEIGSSTGFLLDAIAGHVGAVTGVEPGQLYRDYANRRGIRTIPNLSAVLRERFDMVLAYYVVEHLQHPIERLRALGQLLEPDGALMIEVPNVDDALVRFYAVEGFDRFYWQKAHYFNYSRQTLSLVLERAGLTAQLFPEQRYDLSNHIHWLMAGEPGGKGRYAHIFDQPLDREYARCLKAHWLCDTIFAVARRAGEATR